MRRLHSTLVGGADALRLLIDSTRHSKSGNGKTNQCGMVWLIKGKSGKAPKVVSQSLRPDAEDDRLEMRGGCLTNHLNMLNLHLWITDNYDAVSLSNQVAKSNPTFHPARRSWRRSLSLQSHVHSTVNWPQFVVSLQDSLRLKETEIGF